VASPQSLSDGDRRLVAAWAADCAERVLPLFEAEAPDDDRVRDAVGRTRAFARGEIDTAGEIRRRLVAGRAAHSAISPAGRAAARSAGQAAAVAHMGAHALGAAAYAARAVALDRSPAAGSAEVAWQVDRTSESVRAALRKLPPLGQSTSGPLGPGLLTSGALGGYIREIQAALAEQADAR